ncbi:GGDEF domain-containing protein [Tsuneonella sp. YG55]|uniref:diguanylate cyclase n=1 Tax=Tsuneonella litorea TaxID=2976475 RepID=A0A9X2W3I3_9SPHN|nr:GGDEF domain-containing protein [Tsuneonella litorea]MCT2559091.1 GGDEF domain-containing protein [Tsuneonella litorea]
MRGKVIIEDSGLVRPAPDPRWAAEIRREMIQGIVDVEQRAVIANLACLLLVTFAAVSMPNAWSYALPIAMRVGAMGATRTTFARLRRALAAGGDYKRETRHVVAALAIGGASWAAVLVPVVAEPFLNPGRMLIGGGVLVGVSIIVSLLAPVPRFAGAFCAGFALVFAAGIASALADFAVRASLGMVGLFAIFLSYGFATTSRHRAAAEMLVENRAMSEELAEALAQAEFLAYRDPLTGLLNRRSFFQCAAEHGNDRVRHVITIDLDHFKAINDRFGHETGDRVLVGVAAALRGVIEELDGDGHCAVRLGGEEFAMVVSIAEPRPTVIVAEMVRHAIALVAGELGVRDLVTTASIGICAWQPGQPLDEVLARADRALYRAKSEGRNRVIRARASAR